MERIKPWTAVFTMVNKDDSQSSRLHHRPYDMPAAQKAVTKGRTRDLEQGMPKRKLAPVSTWLFEDAIDSFFENFSKDFTLISLTIVDNRQ